MTPVDVISLGILGLVLAAPTLIVIALGVAVRRRHAFQRKPTGLDRLEERKIGARPGRFGFTHVRPPSGSDIAWCGEVSGRLAGERQTVNCPVCVMACKRLRPEPTAIPGPGTPRSF